MRAGLNGAPSRTTDMMGKTPGAPSSDQSDLNASADQRDLPSGTPAEDSLATLPDLSDDDSLIGVIGVEASSLAQIDAALDMLVNTVDLADVPPVDWDAG